jgi:hypothetical protein
LPDHTHCLWILPEEDADFPSRWRDIKTAFSKSLPGTEQRSAVMIHRGERGIWQRRYWEHTIRDDRDYAALRGERALFGRLARWRRRTGRNRRTAMIEAAECAAPRLRGG